jgi:transcriptional regulator GlxA family with amidase domain
MPRARQSKPRQRATVAVLAFDAISLFHLSVPCLVFGENTRETGLPPLVLKVCAAEPGPLRSTAGVSLHVPFGLDDLDDAGTVIVPSWRDPARRAPQPMLDALRHAHAGGARIVGLCLGAFVLADAGLLDGRAATTHWQCADRFAARFPAVTLDRDVLYVDEGDVVTSAGTAAGLDCCLHLLRSDWGAEVANRVARRMVLAPHRQGGQAQFIEHALPVSGASHRLSTVLEGVLQSLDQPHSLDDLAARAAMGRRTFTRHFRQLTGVTVGQWLLNQRLALAQRLLETTDRSMDDVATLAGLGSAASLRQHFALAFKTSPSAYRRQFGEKPTSDDQSRTELAAARLRSVPQSLRR